MSKKHNFIDAKRRGLIQSSILVTGAAVAGSKVVEASTEVLEAKPQVTLKKSAGYTETEKVREYYRKARF